MKELRVTLEQLKSLDKDKELRKRSPAFHRLNKKFIKTVEEVIRLKATTERVEAKYNKLAVEMTRFFRELNLDEVLNG